MTKLGHFARCRSVALNILHTNGANNIACELYNSPLYRDNALSCTLA